MPATFVLPRQVALSSSNQQLSGALLYFSMTGTTTPQAVHYDAAHTVEAPNPLPANAAGQWAKIYYNPNAAADYRVKITTADGVLIYQEDEISRFPVSADEIGAALFATTPAETAAVIAPTDKTHPELTASRYSITDFIALSEAIAVVAEYAHGRIVIDSVLDITDNITIAANTLLVFERGGKLNISSGKVVTNNNGYIDAPKSTIFIGAGTVIGLREAYAEWWGALATDVSPYTANIAAINKAAAACHSTGGAFGGGRVYLSPGLYLSQYVSGLVIPTDVVVLSNGRAGHIYQFSGDTDTEYMFSAPETNGVGSSNPTVRIHNHSKDGRQIPTLLFSYGPIESSNTALSWSIQGTNYGNADPFTNVQAPDLVIAGGQGSSYTTGTVSVTAASAIVTGVGTSWSSDYIGAILTVGTQNACGIVQSVESATSLTLASIWSTYGGSTAATQAYHLQGGRWFGSATSDYRARLTLGQNYTWLLNSGNLATGDFSPLSVGNGLGAYAANLTMVINGNRLKGGSINPSTLVKLESGSASNGFVGLIFRGSEYAGDPTKSIALLKSSGDLQIGNGTDVSPHIRVTATGLAIDASAADGFSHFDMQAMPVYANNAAALAGGLQVGRTYKTASTGDANVRVVNAT